MSANAARKVTLPEHLEAQIADPKVAVKSFREKEMARMRARLDRRVKKFEEKYADPNSKDHQVLIRQILVNDLKRQISELREAKKELSQEIRALRGNKKRNRSTKKAEKTEGQAPDAK
jgi:hypothetical protein